ncbi:hypothetical protein N656DRAFT_836798 [Canariomyces notabilis]|uniref:GED domain-containing protein n=1 Tax=Canariomyces notabilis TaxID=2074819 RepID=A0AAN6TE56_9PEZI|nr:hypothetical protein N656DRAFT_836798 [Canariomyces arenarius]
MARAIRVDDALSKLCSKDQLALLDAINQLRLQGLSNYISLPQIIVCGDYNLCTRFPTELVLRRNTQRSARVSIVPHESRTESEKEALREFREELSGFDELPKLVENAKSRMGITVHGRAFAKDILRIEISGPDRPHLTITRHQSSADVKLVQDVVQSYMIESRCIILAVVSAKNDFANQIVLKLAREADESGVRTLGIITKPDTLTRDSGSEAMYVALARNQEIAFRHGWHVVKNMDSEKGSWTLSERDAQEAEFFSSGVWTSLPQSSLGVGKLRSRLSKLLLGHIASSLPSLMREISDRFKICKKQLDEFGDPRASLDEQRLYLMQVSQSFHTLVKSSVTGNYIHSFFQDAKTELGYRQRIRAIVQNLNEDFETEISTQGHFREIVNGPLAGLAGTKAPIKIEEETFISQIERLMKKTRGLADLFKEQSQPWEGIARRHVDKVWKAASNFVELIFEHTADPSTAKSLLHEVCEPAMKAILAEMREKIQELLRPHQEGHPITYNDDFARKLQELRHERRRKEIEKTVCETFGVQFLMNNYNLAGGYNLRLLADRLIGSKEPDVKRSAAIDALDCLNAYYKVALKRFIDDVAVEVIEAKLVSALNKILDPVSVYQMPTDQVSRIAGEPEETRIEREQLNRQLEVLRNGLDTCKRFIGFRFGDASVNGKRSFDDLDSDSEQPTGGDSQKKTSEQNGDKRLASGAPQNQGEEEEL